MSEYHVTSASGQRMMTYLPRYYESSRIMRALSQARGEEIDKLRQTLDETLEQFSVNTATWGLDTWEQELGIVPNPSSTGSERRDRIVSKIRGYGTATISVVKQVAESYDRGRIDIAEDHAGYKITVFFVDTTGIPTNVDDLKAAVRAVVPAHLEIEYQYKYLFWDQLDAANKTWDQIDALSLDWDHFETGGWLNA